VLALVGLHLLEGLEAQEQIPPLQAQERSLVVAVVAQTLEHLALVLLAKSSSLSSLHKELNYDNLCSNRKRN
jgi:hypothetical protein